MASTTPGRDDFRLFDIVTDADLPHRALIVRPPQTLPTIVNPTELRFLADIEGFHTGDTRNPTISRVQDTYNDLVHRTIAFLGCLAAILETVELVPPRGYNDPLRTAASVINKASNALFRLIRSSAQVFDDLSNFRGWLEKEVNLAFLPNTQLLYDFCERYEIYGKYPIDDLLQRTYAVMKTVILHPFPRFQTKFFSDLPVELVMMIASFADPASQRNLAATSHLYRAICAPVAFKSAKFTMLYEHDAFLEERFGSSVLSYLRTMKRAIDTALSAFAAQVGDFLQSPLHVRNLRELVLDNEWAYIYPSYISSPPPSILGTTVYGPLYDEFKLLLSSTNAITLHVRGFGLNYRMLDCIGSHPTLRRLCIERCLPVVARPGGIDVDYQQRFSAMFGTSIPDDALHLNATMYRLAYLAIGFGSHDSMNNRNWNIVALCLPTVLKQLFLYPADAGAIVNWPISDLWGLIAPVVHQLEYLHIDGCHRVVSFLADMCEKGISDGLSGHWKRFKMRSMTPMDRPAFDDIMQYIRRGQPNLSVLIIEGLRHIPSVVVHQIAEACPNLEALSLARRARFGLTLNTLSVWNDPLDLYLTASMRFQKLRNLCVNLMQNPYSLDPEMIPRTDPDSPYDGHGDDDEMLDEISTESDDELAEELGGTHSLDQIEDEPLWPEPPLGDDGPEHNSPVALAYKFHLACPTLESFAIRAETTVFRCVIRPLADGGVSFGNVSNHEKDEEHKAWNPYLGDTWETGN